MFRSFGGMDGLVLATARWPALTAEIFVLPLGNELTLPGTNSRLINRLDMIDNWPVLTRLGRGYPHVTLPTGPVITEA